MEFRTVVDRQVAGIVALLCCLLTVLPGFQGWEAKTEDIRFVLRGKRKTQARIVLAPISDNTLQLWKDEPLALWGGHLAEALKGAKQAEALVVGVDFVLGVDADSYLQSVAHTVLQLEGRSTDDIQKFDAKLTDSAALQPNTALLKFVMEDPNFTVFSNNGKLVETLRGAGLPIAQVRVPEEEQHDDQVRILRHQDEGGIYLPSALAQQLGAPLGARKPYGINYIAPLPDASFPIVPFEHLKNPNESDRVKLKGACVLIGVTYTESKDSHTGVLGQSFMGLELQGQALATLLDGAGLSRGAWWSELLWTVLLASLGFCLLLPQVRFVWAGLGSVVLLVLYFAFAQWCFTVRFYWLPIAAPFLSVILPFVAFHLTRALIERKNRQLVERVFGQYLSPSVRDYLLASPENRQLGGRQAEATVLFFDLRGSTSFAEGRAPGLVLTELNALFSQVVPVFQQHEGTVLRYSGDGFLAVFGAPTPDSQHAIHALAAVAAVQKALTQWNQERAQRGEFTWQYGMGLHSGALIWGSLGSADRPELTLIGDTVNIAARLQDASKAFEAIAVVSEETWKTAGMPSLEGPQSCVIRGRRDSMNVYLVKEGLV